MDTTFSISEELRRYLALFWHWAWLLVLCTLLAMGISFLVSVRTTPVYQASAKVLVNEAPMTKSQDYASVLTSERLTQTYSQMLVTEDVLQGVVDKLGLNTGSAALRRAIQVEPVRDTQLIDIRVLDVNPQRAADIVNTLVDEFSHVNNEMQSQRFATSKESLQVQMDDIEANINQTTLDLQGLSDTQTNEAARSRLETTLAQYRQIYANLLMSLENVRLAEAQTTSNLQLIEKATAPTRPVRPQTARNVALAGIVGIMLGFGIVFLIEAFDDTIKGPDDITRQLGLPVLALIARYEKDIKLITSTHPRSPIAESFRSLRTNLQFASVDYPVHTILVTSPSPGDGKSSISANLAIVLAQSGRKVTLVDADLRRPNLHKILDMSNKQGISSLFVQPKVSLNGSIQPSPVQNMWVLTAGDVPPNPSELLGSAKMLDILGKVKELMDVIIIDTPPVMAVTDSAVLASRVDGVIIVVKPGSTNLAAARQTVEQLRRVGANIMGVVLNEVNISRSRYRYYRYKGYYYTHYHYDKDSTEKENKGEILGISLKRNGNGAKVEPEKQAGNGAG